MERDPFKRDGKLITAKHEARSLCAALEKYWLIGLYARNETDVIEEARRAAADALERLNALADDIDIAPLAPVIPFPNRGDNFRTAGRVETEPPAA